MNCCNDFGRCHGGKGCPAREACAIDPMHPPPQEPLPTLESAMSEIESSALTLLSFLAGAALCGLIVGGATYFLYTHPRVLAWLWG